MSGRPGARGQTSTAPGGGSVASLGVAVAWVELLGGSVASSGSTRIGDGVGNRVGSGVAAGAAAGAAPPSGAVATRRGTAWTLPHWGHFAFLPACSSGARNLRPHWEHTKE